MIPLRYLINVCCKQWTSSAILHVFKVLLLLSQSFSNLKLDDINFFVFLLTWILVKLVLVT